MGNKTTKKKKHTQPGQTDRRIRGAILVLVILILCVAAYGISTLLPKGAGKKKEGHHLFIGIQDKPGKLTEGIAGAGGVHSQIG